MTASRIHQNIQYESVGRLTTKARRHKEYGCHLLQFFVSLCLGGSTFQFKGMAKSPCFYKKEKSKKLTRPSIRMCAVMPTVSLVSLQPDDHLAFRVSGHDASFGDAVPFLLC